MNPCIPYKQLGALILGPFFTAQLAFFKAKTALRNVSSQGPIARGAPKLELFSGAKMIVFGGFSQAKS